MFIIVTLFRRGRSGLLGRAVGRRRRIAEIVLTDGGRFRLHLRNAARNGIAFPGSFLRITLTVAHILRARGLRGPGRLNGSGGLHGRNARGARPGVERRIPVKDQIVCVSSCGIAAIEQIAAAAVRLLAGDGRRGGRRRCRRRRRNRRRRRTGRRNCGLFRQRDAGLGLRKVAECDRLGLFGHLARACRGKQQRAQRRGDEDKPQRKQDEQRIEDIRPDGRKRGAHGIGNEPEQNAAPRSVGKVLGRGGPAACKIAAVAVAEKRLGRGGMYDEKDGGKQKIHPCDPARGNKLFAEHHYGGAVHGKQEQRVDVIARQPHEKRRDRKPYVAKHIPSRNGYEEDDRAEQKKGHADRLFRQKRPLVFIFLFLSATHSVHAGPPYLLPTGEQRL